MNLMGYSNLPPNALMKYGPDAARYAQDVISATSGMQASAPTASKRKWNPFDWGVNDPLSNEKMGSAIKSGSQAISGILDQGESDRQRQYQAAMNEDELARQAYDAKRRAAFQSAALSSLAAV